MAPGQGGGVRVLAGARVELRRIAVVDCGAALGGSAISVGADTVAVLEDVRVIGHGLAPGDNVLEGSPAVVVSAARSVRVRDSTSREQRPAQTES